MDFRVPGYVITSLLGGCTWISEYVITSLSWVHTDFRVCHEVIVGGCTCISESVMTLLLVCAHGFQSMS